MHAVLQELILVWCIFWQLLNKLHDLILFHGISMNYDGHLFILQMHLNLFRLSWHNFAFHSISFFE